ncbi:tetratricopeptide repeat protein [Kordia sp. SMS9]|uniref:tetratricopeptide repeat protein n=1 Tax=Kordia sp. SMS9 TaxID=2282170 RepID=UPI000E0E0849|nr:tetratricopeptide repeat protein [Kordia sp. SMS9]AXG68487.1 tetratricopeptide repeat protein [Kordia sp. SMS9]
MKNTIIFFCTLFIFNVSFSQSDTKEIFRFDKKYYEAVDKWVVSPRKATDTTYSLSFIYIDEQAGFTENFETELSVTANGLKKVKSELDNVSFKARLSNTTISIAILSPEQVKQLGLPEQPDWLKSYKQNAGTVSYLTKMGYYYNHVGASKLALTPLLKAYEKEPHFEGLEFELSYAYNAIKQFKKAITVLEKAIQNNPNDYYFFRELGYSYKNLNQVVDAERIYKKGISISDNDFEKSEMAVNMAQTYFELRNRKKFDEWAKLTRKFAKEGSRYAKFIDYFESKWNEK